MRRLLLALSTLVGACLLSNVACADQGVNKAISTTGTYGYLGLGLLLPLVQDASDGLVHSARELDSLVVSLGLSIGIEDLTHIRTPNGSSHSSFPSNHATAAFAMATMQSQFHPNETLLWYAGAAAISNSMVELREHRWTDVIAGAALGFTTARIELSNHRGLLLYPIMNDDGGFGAEMSMKF